MEPTATDGGEERPAAHEAAFSEPAQRSSPVCALALAFVSVIVGGAASLILLHGVGDLSVGTRTLIGLASLAAVILPLEYVAVFRPLMAQMSRCQDLLKQTRELAVVDPLTCLYNRRGFVAVAGKELEVAKRMNRAVVVLFVDLDGLKRINDTFGHREGDKALTETAELLKATFRQADVLARIGGDEFVVLGVESGEKGVEIMPARLKESVGANNAKSGRKYDLSLSVGVVRWEASQIGSIDTIVAHADRHMYSQKAKGRAS